MSGKKKHKGKRSRSWKRIRSSAQHQALRQLSPEELLRLEHRQTRGWARGELDKYTTGVRRVVSGGLPSLGKRR